MYDVLTPFNFRDKWQINTMWGQSVRALSINSMTESKYIKHALYLRIYYVLIYLLMYLFSYQNCTKSIIYNAKSRGFTLNSCISSR